MFWARVSFENVFPVFITSSTLLLIHCSLRLLYQLTSWYANETQTQMQSGGTNEEIDVDLRLSVIKPLHATWLWVFFENVFPVFITSSTLLLIHCSLRLLYQLTSWYANETQTQMQSGVTNEEIEVDLRPLASRTLHSRLPPFLVSWLPFFIRRGSRASARDIWCRHIPSHFCD